VQPPAPTRQHPLRRILDALEHPIALLDSRLTPIFLNQAAYLLLDLPTDVDPGLTPDRFSVHPDDKERFGDALRQLVVDGPGAHTFVALKLWSGGRWKPVECTGWNASDEPGISAIVCTLVDREREELLARSLRQQQTLTTRNDQLFTQLQDREAFLVQLIRFQTSLSRRAPLTTVLQSVVDAARELMCADFTTLVIEEPAAPGSEKGLLLAAHSGFTDQQLPRVRLQSPQEGIGGLAYRENRAVVVDDYGRSSDETTLLASLNVQTALGVPIRYDNRAVGALIVASQNPSRRLTDLEVEMMSIFAEFASLALRDARTLEEIKAALNDPLTGLPNRQLLLNRLTQSLDRGRRQSASTAVLFIDLTGLKVINDSRGHTVGDRVLRESAIRLNSCIRGNDTAARLGGDEFVVVIEQATPDLVISLAQRIVDELTQDVLIDDMPYAVGVSIGVSLDLDGRSNPAQLIEEADIAMFRAKAAGVVGPVFFETSMHDEVEDRAKTERELRFAIRTGGIKVAYQPVGDLRTGFVYGVEALARWTSPTKGEIPPSLFVALAEQTGNVVSLDRAVLRAALDGAIGLVDPVSGRPLMLNVNVSSQHLDNDEVIEDVAAALLETGFPAKRLTLEITETDVMRDAVRSMERLHTMKGMGVHVALDDFGTGYSSLAYLRQFPVDTLKIDRAFVTGIDSQRDSKAYRLIEAMIGLGHALDMQVLAEGVETLNEALTLRSMGLDLLQGYWLAKPVPAAQLESAMASVAERLFEARSSVRSGRTLTRVNGWN
jgi:diguanylate cyclase (GGDEF)-like protein